jgi:octaprenyl-diphosphate synthase
LLAGYGRDLGIAFQIADDLLDLLGDEAVAGKSLGTDLVKQKTTLPLIRLLEQLDAADREKVLEFLGSSSNHNREILKPWFEQTDAIAYAKARAKEYLESAIGRLATLEESDAVTSLRALAEFAINRDR